MSVELRILPFGAGVALPVKSSGVFKQNSNQLNFSGSTFLLKDVLNDIRNGLPNFKPTKTICDLCEQHNLSTTPIKGYIGSVLAPHLQNTRKICLHLADRFNLNQVAREDLSLAAFIHDIGKIFIPKSISEKKGSLTAFEVKIMQLHPVFGSEILRTYGTAVKPAIINMVAQHHLPWCENPPALTQYLSAADVLDALTSERCYREALSVPTSIAIMREDARAGRLNPEIVEVLAKDFLPSHKLDFSTWRFHNKINLIPSHTF